MDAGTTSGIPLQFPPINMPLWMEWLIHKCKEAPVFPTLLGLVFIDILLGILLSIVRGTLSSSVAWRGMVKKIAMLLIVATCYVASGIIPNIPSFELACIAFVVAELISILEGAALCGVPLPRVFILALVKLKEAQNLDNLLKSGGPLSTGNSSNSNSGGTTAVINNTVVATPVGNGDSANPPSPTSFTTTTRIP